VDRCLHAGADGIALSGGFDSVSLAVLSRERGADRPPLRAVSLRFDGAGCDEGGTQAAVARSLELPQSLLTVAESLDGREPLEVALAFSRWSPNPVASVFQALYTGLFRTARAQGLRRLLFGTGGDDFLNVDPAYGADLLGGLRLPALWRYLRATQRTSPFAPATVARLILWDGAARPVLRQAGGGAVARVAPGWWATRRRERARRRLPDWFAHRNTALAETLTDRLLAPDPLVAPGGGRYVRAMRALSQSPLLLDELDQGQAWLRHFGLEALYPYFDRDLVALLLRVPPERLIEGGWYKAPLRRLVRERLPEVPLPRKKVDFTAMMHQMVRPAGPATWRRLGGPQRLSELGICRPDAVNRLVDGYHSAEHDHWLAVWLIISTESWLQARSHHRADIAVAA
jgi:asparagine synthase (glutamine-hydrolysing)